jgi:two-component system alkaline phosphatase synthesis response regulator PhoP
MTTHDLTSPEELLVVGPLEIAPAGLIVRAAGVPMHLTMLELRLLTELALRPGRIVTRSELYEAVWERPLRVGDRSVDVCVRKLRAKLDALLPDWRFIHTHFALGYRLEPLAL